MQQLAEQLRAVGVPTFPCWARYNGKREKWDKGPAVPKGEPWQMTSLRPVTDPFLDWSAGVIGVPIPTGVLVIDLDGYKGASRQAIESLLGCPLPWDDAFIQTTIGGGEHYAFYCDWEARQGDSIDGLQGFDTRAAGRGFICSGKGYAPVMHGGVLGLGTPASLPQLPEAAKAVLGKKEATPNERTETTTTDKEDVLDALKHIDPECSRAQWRNVGYSLKAIYQDNDGEGLDVFDAWSAGEYWDGNAPSNYVSDGKGSTADQWPTFKAEGGVSSSTLYYWAIQGGWKPPAKFNAAAAFGPDAAPADAFNELVERIRHDGADIKNTGDIVEAIQSAGCNALQVALLAAELKTELNAAGVKDKAVAGHIDGLLRTKPPTDMITPAPGMYGKNDTDNAVTFLEKYYPDGTLARCDEEFYVFTGKAWEAVTSATIKGQIYKDMATQRMNESKMGACYRTIVNLAPVRDGMLNNDMGDVVIFQNGVLNLTTMALAPHNRDLFTTNIMPYDWAPGGACPDWLTFLDDAFSGDPERVALLQEWFGYMLTRGYSWQKILVLLGGPRSGKGTIGRVLSALTGKQNFSGGHLSAFASDSFLAGLRTKTVLFIGDAAKRVPPNKINEVVERLKSISGNDEINFDRKFMSALSEALPTRITIAANSVPQLFDDSGALASRMLLLTFDKSHLGSEDLTLGDRLHAEIQGIAAWAVEGLHRLRSVGRFTAPKACEEEIKDIADSYSPLMCFLEEGCTPDPEGVITSVDLYEAYRVWAVSQHEDLVKPKTFTRSIKDSLRGRGVTYGPHRVGDEIVRGFKGLSLHGGATKQTIQGAFKPTVVK